MVTKPHASVSEWCSTMGNRKRLINNYPQVPALRLSLKVHRRSLSSMLNKQSFCESGSPGKETVNIVFRPGINSKRHYQNINTEKSLRRY
jgi:hypothetical protein